MWVGLSSGGYRGSSSVSGAARGAAPSTTSAPPDLLGRVRVPHLLQGVVRVAMAAMRLEFPYLISRTVQFSSTVPLPRISRTVQFVTIHRPRTVQCLAPRDSQERERNRQKQKQSEDSYARTHERQKCGDRSIPFAYGFDVCRCFSRTAHPPVITQMVVCGGTARSASTLDYFRVAVLELHSHRQVVVRLPGRGRGCRRCRVARPRCVRPTRVSSHRWTSETAETSAAANRRGGQRVVHASFSRSGKTADEKNVGVRGISLRFPVSSFGWCPVRMKVTNSYKSRIFSFLGFCVTHRNSFSSFIYVSAFLRMKENRSNLNFFSEKKKRQKTRPQGASVSTQKTTEPKGRRR